MYPDGVLGRPRCRGVGTELTGPSRYKTDLVRCAFPPQVTDRPDRRGSSTPMALREVRAVDVLPCEAPMAEKSRELEMRFSLGR